MRQSNVTVSKGYLALGLGYENASAINGRGEVQGNLNAQTEAYKSWKFETVQQLGAAIAKESRTFNDGGILDNAGRATAIRTLQSSAIETLVGNYTKEHSMYATLPEEVKNICGSAHAVLVHTEKQLGLATEASEKFKLNFKKNMAIKSLEGTLWNILSGIHSYHHNSTSANGTQATEAKEILSNIGSNLAHNLAIAGNESGINTYSNQIFIPKVSAITQAMRIASTVQDKVQKSKTVLDAVVEIPVTTEITYIKQVDKDGKVVAEYKREDALATMDLSKTIPELLQAQERELVLGATEIGTLVKYRETVLVATGKPFLGPKEHVGPQIGLVSYTMEAGDGTLTVHDGYIGDVRAGIAQGPTMGQLDTKGKMIPGIFPDPTKLDEELVFSMDADHQKNTMRVFINYSKPTMGKVVSITLHHSIRDVENIDYSPLRITSVLERTTLKVPVTRRYVIPVLTDENLILAERGTANMVQKTIESTVTFSNAAQESTWLGEYLSMKKRAKALKYPSPGKVEDKILYAEQNVDLNVTVEVNKEEALGYHLSNNLTLLKTKLEKDSNCSGHVQLSMFTGTLSIHVMNPLLELVTGDINENSDNKFLGIAQSDRVRALTVGSKKGEPVSAIIVATDKSDFDAVGWKNGAAIPTPEVVYDFHIIPSYSDEKINTTVMVQMPTKLISGSEYRAVEYLTVPAMIMIEGYKFNVLRDCAAHVSITGSGVNGTAFNG